MQAWTGDRLAVRLAAVDPDQGQTVEISTLGALPAGARLFRAKGNPASATLRWTPTAAEAGSHEVTVVARDDGEPALMVARSYTLVVRRTPAPVTLSGVDETWRVTGVLRPVVARSAPLSNARRVAVLATRTPEQTGNLVLALESLRDRAGVTWVRVRLPILPNNSTGWVRRDALGPYRVLRTHLVIDRSALTATLFRAGRVVFRTRVGVGRPYWPTPRGEFYVRDRLTGFGDPFYGPIAFGTSARSAVLTDWPGGGFIGIHGTDRPGLLPGRVSHGCIRLRNDAIVRLARLMPIGTPLTVR